MKGRGKRYQLIYASIIKQYLQAIERKHHSLIRRKIEDQLTFQPDVETMNRKPLQEPFIFEASWEIRFGSNNRFRVFYDVDKANREVKILAIGVKRRNRIFIGREEI